MKPKYYKPSELASYGRPKLETIAEARGVEPVGTGADSYVTMDDLRAAITADQDGTGVNPAVQAVEVPEALGTFIVTGGLPVYGYVYGECFTMTDTPALQALVAGGAIKPAEVEPDPTDDDLTVEPPMGEDDNEPPAGDPPSSDELEGS